MNDVEMVVSVDNMIITDLRFPGGSSSSTLEEMRVNRLYDVTTGVYHLPSLIIKRRRSFHAGITKELITGDALFLNVENDKSFRTKLLSIRHPNVLYSNSLLPNVNADNVILVVNHPPRNAKGRIDYDLVHCVHIIQETYGATPLIYPIGPLIREQIDRTYGSKIQLAANDWVNIFDCDRFYTERNVPSGALKVGRHSRPGPEKWPCDPSEILAAYPDQPDVEVHVLGGAAAPVRILGYLPDNWRVYEFGTQAVEDFLRNIDVFVYFHHPNWVEAFGRVILEAMATGLPVILPRHFHPLVGDAALFAEPHEVASRLAELRSPAKYREYSRRSLLCARRFSYHVHRARLREFGLANACDERLPDA